MLWRLAHVNRCGQPEALAAVASVPVGWRHDQRHLVSVARAHAMRTRSRQYIHVGGQLYIQILKKLR